MSLSTLSQSWLRPLGTLVSCARSSGNACREATMAAPQAATLPSPEVGGSRASCGRLEQLRERVEVSHYTSDLVGGVGFDVGGVAQPQDVTRLHVGPDGGAPRVRATGRDREFALALPSGRISA